MSVKGVKELKAFGSLRAMAYSEHTRRVKRHEANDESNAGSVDGGVVYVARVCW